MWAMRSMVPEEKKMNMVLFHKKVKEIQKIAAQNKELFPFSQALGCSLLFIRDIDNRLESLEEMISNYIKEK